MRGRLGTPIYGAAAWVVLAAVAVFHIGIGARYISPATVVAALFSYDGSLFDHKIIVELRLLRLLAGVFGGAAFAASGVLLQSIIRNPLGEPHILGLNAGAAFAIIAGMATGASWITGVVGRPLVGMGGAAILFGLIMAISSAGKGGPTPLKVTLCGIALSAFASSLTSTLLILDDQTLMDMRLWLAGDLSGLTYGAVLSAIALSVVGFLLAFFLAPRLNVLELGDIAAVGLGVNLSRTRLIGLMIAALLCGSAVSIMGPIGFVGLVAPHFVKRFVSGDIRVVLSFSVVVGAILLLIADILARTIVAPQELATGIMTAVIGAPLFISIVRRSFR